MPTPATTRAQDVTEMVELWIANDGDHYGRALILAAHYREEGSHGLVEYLTEAIQTAVDETKTPYYIRRDLAPSDYDLIDWDAIAESLQEN